jgi:endo-1,4-beta-xylanase
MTENRLPEIPPSLITEPSLGEHSLSRRGFLGVLGAAFLTAACSGEDQPTPPTPSASEQAPDNRPVPAELDASKEHNVLKGAWDFMPGTKREGTGLRIEHTGLALLTSGGTGRPVDNPSYQPNPPVNLFGEYVEHDGLVGFMARLSDIKGAATVSLMTAPPIRRDESITRQPGVDVTIDGNKAIISLWDKKGRPTTSEIPLPQAASNADISVVQTGEELRITVNGQEQRIAAAQLLKKQAWFGFDAVQSWKLDRLAAYPVLGSEISTVDASKAFEGVNKAPDGLASIAAAHGHKDKLIGTAVDLAELMANPEYTKFVIENFNEIQTETLGKLQAWQPEEGKFEFAELDALVKFANGHGLQIHGHCLVFTEAYPKWVADKLLDLAADKAKLLEQVITPIVTRYNGKNGHGQIGFWDVVNEPFDPDKWGELNRQSIWYKALGSDYIAQAFKIAKQANPDAKLFMNDWGAETDANRRDAMVNLATKLKDQGVPIDGLGFQAHIDEETLADSSAMGELYNGALTKLFSRLQQRNLLARISEASVAKNNNETAQSQAYETLMRDAMRAPNCIGINFWGMTNSKFRNAYFTGNPRSGDPGNDAPTTQDVQGNIIDRPAMDGLRRGAAV